MAFRCADWPAVNTESSAMQQKGILRTHPSCREFNVSMAASAVRAPCARTARQCRTPQGTTCHMTTPESERIVITMPMSADDQWSPVQRSPSPATQLRTNGTARSRPSPVSTAPRFSPCIPSPRGTWRRANMSGRRWALEWANCATATNSASRHDLAPTCTFALSLPAPPSLWQTFCPESFKPRPASNPSPSRSRAEAGFPRRCPRCADATTASAWRGARPFPEHLPSPRPTSI